jgi:signal peptidase II
LKIGLWTALLALAADQLTKGYLQDFFEADPTVRVQNPYFNVVNVWNTGVSFSMFDRGGLLGTVVLIAFALGVIGFLCRWLYHEKDRLTCVSLGLIIGGAIGNVIDRIRFGAVYDFLDFHYAAYHWPAFNLADTFICIGAALIIWTEVQRYARNKLKGENK